MAPVDCEFGRGDCTVTVLKGTRPSPSNPANAIGGPRSCKASQLQLTLSKTGSLPSLCRPPDYADIGIHSHGRMRLQKAAPCGGPTLVP